jgi:hypothetical protein
MMKLLKRLTEWWISVGNGKLTVTSLDNPFISKQTEQQDPRTQEVRKRVRKAFEEQAQQISMMAMKQHACQDPLSCKKEKCFVFEPDKIISKKPIVTKKKTNFERWEEKRKKKSYYDENA